MTSIDRRRALWAVLSRRASSDPASYLSLIQRLGPDQAATAILNNLIDELYEGQWAGAFECAIHDLERIERLGGRFVIPGDPEWPANPLANMSDFDAAPEWMVPAGLWVRGRPLNEVLRPALAVVGARASSTYGEHVTGEIVTAATSHGWTILSGGAYGVDAAAHRAALASGGVTVAVIGGGLDRAYPLEHQALFEQIADTGALISEYPPGVRPQKTTLLARHRLIAALSRAVVVVEAGLRASSRATTERAARIGRPVFAVPGPITSATSRGCHELIAARQAQCVTSTEQLITALSALLAETP
ncbi:DNA-processing protein DprA [Nocardia sp. XZ_19_385]|uniref:DNA-processing protein DprA n=1 Tax=Nocardia sp. XZ_19_385 TaxID=2769488 RepID=UPI00188F8220|nr:DNA-processing protein DprA [Nocardia sp. XZ_19_385]